MIRFIKKFYQYERIAFKISLRRDELTNKRKLTIKEAKELLNIWDKIEKLKNIWYGNL